MPIIRNIYFIIFLGVLMPEKITTAKPFPDVEKALEEGITAFYDTRWDDARKQFSALQIAFPNDPRPFFFEAMIPFWGYFFLNKESDSADLFLDRSAKAINIAENWLEKHPQDTTVVLMLGGLHGYQSLVAASEKRYRTALRSGIRSFSFSDQLMKMEGNNPDILIGQGVFHYMAGNIPGEVRWLARLLGMRGNKETGLEKLERAVTKETHTSTDAGMILTYLYHEEEKYEDALRIVRHLIQRWPDNYIFNYYLALTLEKTGHFSEAAIKYEELLNTHHTEFKSIRKEIHSRWVYLLKERDPSS